MDNDHDRGPEFLVGPFDTLSSPFCTFRNVLRAAYPEGVARDATLTRDRKC